MILRGHLCVPQGDSMNELLTAYMNHVVKPDNRKVIAAMLASRQHVPDTVGDLGLSYLPEEHQIDEETGEAVIDVYGMRAMVDRGTFSCADAAGYEAAILEEKYGITTWCLSVAQGDDAQGRPDAHAVFVTRDRVIDPTYNFLHGRRDTLRVRPLVRTANACSIQNGRVVCEEDLACSVDEHGVWSCPEVPGLSGRRESLVRLHESDDGSWAKTRSGAVVPLVRRGRMR